MICMLRKTGVVEDDDKESMAGTKIVRIVDRIVKAKMGNDEDGNDKNKTPSSMQPALVISTPELARSFYQ